ncbi:MAG: CRTAC1 family protein [Candidatus Thiodiazotropha sp. (ex Epidulcina cf. delphinae)]|nr:CRTAC1 family protein [Candidatus Thiodiazotropha sp. (ex Epidulcina cf. delphinae)]
MMLLARKRLVKLLRGYGYVFMAFIGYVGSLTAFSVAADWFDEVGVSSGIDYTGASYGASWGDVNGDGWPDLWAGNHGLHGSPRLYLNNGNGTFSDATQVVAFKMDDLHGAAWADIDNDGDQDLLVQVGAKSGAGSGPNQLFINREGILQENAQAYGLEYPLGRGRTPLFFDWNRDGRLDVLLTNIARPDGEAPTALFLQTDSGFVDGVNQTGMNVNGTSNLFAQVLAVGQKSPPFILIHGSIPSYPAGLYDPQVIPFHDSSRLLGLFDDEPRVVHDVAIADFDGDLLSDVFFSRTSAASEAVQTESNVISAHLKLGGGGEQGFSFRADGAVQVEISPPWVIDASDIYIGSKGVKSLSTSFTLNSSDSDSLGIMPHIPGTYFGLFIGYDIDTGLWQVLVSKSSWLRTDILITAERPITDLQQLGFTNSDGSREDRLLLQTESSFVDQSVSTGTNRQTACDSVTAADFDNDMDVDLYLVCTGSATNRSNILYENQGNNSFQEVPNAGGASGSSVGRGESATSVDYDEDGYVDIFVTNGGGGALFNNGPSQLFRNTGSGAHWLEIDLIGVVSNRDATGARVLLTADGITQVRVQDGGIHRYSQDHQRIHFGLADKKKVDHITVYWPSGIVQRVYGVHADQIITVVEDTQPIFSGMPDAYRAGAQEGVFVWKNETDNTYHLRVSGDGDWSEFVIKLVSTESVSATPYKLESNDSWSASEYGFSLTSEVSSHEDGVDFTVPSEAKVLISVEKEGVSNPRYLRSAVDGVPLSPAGWILSSTQIASRPVFIQGEDDGLFVGQGSSQGVLEARYVSGQVKHRVGLSIISSKRIKNATFLELENDKTYLTNSSVAIRGFVYNGWDGVDISINHLSDVGISYTADSLLQPRMVNLNLESGAVVHPNAYWLQR